MSRSLDPPWSVTAHPAALDHLWFWCPGRHESADTVPWDRPSLLPGSSGSGSVDGREGEEEDKRERMTEREKDRGRNRWRAGLVMRGLVSQSQLYELRQY